MIIKNKLWKLTFLTIIIFCISACGRTGDKGDVLPYIPVPLNLIAKADVNSIEISWSAIDDASYKVYYGNSTGSFKGEDADQGKSPVATDNNEMLLTGLTKDIYYIAISSVVNGAESVKSKEIVVVLETPDEKPSPPSTVTVTPSNASAAVSWSEVSEASSYRLYWGTQTRNYTSSFALEGTSHTITGLTNGTIYYIAVTARNANGESHYSLEKTAVPQGGTNNPPSPPSSVTLTPGNSQMQVSWSSVSGATSYRVYWDTNSGDPYANSHSATATSYTVGGLTNGTTYYFAVTASNSYGESIYSGEVSEEAGLAQPPGAPSITNVTASDSQIALTWNAVATATSYKVYWGTSTGSYPYNHVLASTNYTITGLTNGTMYYIAVTASNTYGEGNYSIEETATPSAALLNPPGNINLDPGNAIIDVNWSPVSGAASYKVYHGTSPAVYGTPTTVAGTNHTITGLTNGQWYYIAVSTVNGDGVEGNLSPEQSTMPNVYYDTVELLPEYDAYIRKGYCTSYVDCNEFPEEWHPPVTIDDTKLATGSYINYDYPQARSFMRFDLAAAGIDINQVVDAKIRIVLYSTSASGGIHAHHSDVNIYRIPSWGTSLEYDNDWDLYASGILVGSYPGADPVVIMEYPLNPPASYLDSGETHFVFMGGGMRYWFASSTYSNQGYRPKLILTVEQTD